MSDSIQQDTTSDDASLAHDPERVFYNDGFAEGSRDGVLGGKAEGRSMGLKTGFEKFVEAGRLAGRSVVWASQQKQKQQEKQQQTPTRLPSSQLETLPPLPAGNRLARNVEAVYALVDPATLSTENTDDSVDDFDDRLKRAQGKMRVVMMALDGRGSDETSGGDALEI